MLLVGVPPDAPRDELGPLPPEVELVEWPGGSRADEVDVLVLAPPAGPALAAALPRMGRLRLVQTLNAGVDRVPPLPAGVLLANSGAVHDGPVAEWVLAVVLAMQKRLPELLDAQRGHRWDTGANLAFGTGPAARDVAGSRVLVIGQGSIGTAVRTRLEAFGAHVDGIARRPRPGVHGPDALPALLPGADVVVLLTPATPETAGLVDAAFLRRMAPGALLVNAARGALVDTAALLDALHEGRVRAALDATDPEPLPADSPLWSAPGVLITPHVAGSSAHWRARAYRLVGDQLRRCAAGEPVRHVREHGY